MAETSVHATFDGKVLCPEEPLELPPNSRVRLTIELADSEVQPKRPASFLKAAQALDLKGPPDWSSRLEEYLYAEVPSRDA